MVLTNRIHWAKHSRGTCCATYLRATSSTRASISWCGQHELPSGAPKDSKNDTISLSFIHKLQVITVRKIRSVFHFILFDTKCFPRFKHRKRSLYFEHLVTWRFRLKTSLKHRWSLCFKWCYSLNSMLRLPWRFIDQVPIYWFIAIQGLLPVQQRIVGFNPMCALRTCVNSEKTHLIIRNRIYITILSILLRLTIGFPFSILIPRFSWETSPASRLPVCSCTSCLLFPSIFHSFHSQLLSSFPLYIILLKFFIHFIFQVSHLSSLFFSLFTLTYHYFYNLWRLRWKGIFKRIQQKRGFTLFSQKQMRHCKKKAEVVDYVEVDNELLYVELSCGHFQRSTLFFLPSFRLPFAYFPNFSLIPKLRILSCKAGWRFLSALTTTHSRN